MRVGAVAITSTAENFASAIMKSTQDKNHPRVNNVKNPLFFTFL